jgi:sugar (pentulose or hexulose) kinase
VGAFGAVADRVAWGTSFRVTSLFRPATMPTMTPALRAQIASVVRHEWDGDIPEPVLVGALDAALTAYGARASTHPPRYLLTIGTLGTAGQASQLTVVLTESLSGARTVRTTWLAGEAHPGARALRLTCGPYDLVLQRDIEAYERATAPPAPLAPLAPATASLRR